MKTILDSKTRAAADLYVGEPGELIRQSSDNLLQLHDGSTPGGTDFLPEAVLDSKYQPRSAELDGIKFEPAAKGWLVRIAAGVYRLRKLLVGSSALTIQNADGVGGDIRIDLADEIPGNRKFLGAVTLVEPLAASQGVDGPLRGDSTGTHTGKQTGGDVDVRGFDLTVDADALPIAAIEGLQDALSGAVAGNFQVPLGTIWMFGGTVIPQGWALCNGENGTPDLTDRFVLGAATLDAAGEIGGTPNHLHVVTAAEAGSHQHDVNVQDTTLSVDQMPKHKHISGPTDTGSSSQLFAFGWAAVPTTPNSIDDNGADGNISGYTNEVGGSQPHTHVASSAAAGTHSHAIAMEAADHLPPFIRIAYIMKVS